MLGPWQTQKTTKVVMVVILIYDVWSSLIGWKDIHKAGKSVCAQLAQHYSILTAPYTRLITTSALAQQSQHRNANPAPAR